MEASTPHLSTLDNPLRGLSSQGELSQSKSYQVKEDYVSPH
jgi:hypothetical protein